MAGFVNRLVQMGTVVALMAMAVPSVLGQAPVAGTVPKASTSSVATPHMPDGHPDLSGLWNGGGGGQRRGPDENGNLVLTFTSRPCSPGQTDCAPGVNFVRDMTFTDRFGSRPWYKPEFWDKVQYLDLNTNKMDPQFKCQPVGVPRMGPPTKIIQTSTEAIFLYAQGGALAVTQDFRIIPLDGRRHDPFRSKDLTYYGDAVGRWKGDTLVVDSLGFNDITWLARGGYFHTIDMHVIETFRRVGNTLTWQATVEDPAVLLRPWVMDPVTRNLNPDPKATIIEGLPCEERDAQHMVTQERK